MIEILEPRIAPAALIDITTKNGSAIIKVHGSAESNDGLSVVGQADGSLKVQGLFGETFTVNGVAGTGPQTLPAITQDVTIDLGKGDDSVLMSNLQLGGKLTLKMGEGTNVVSIMSSTVGGAMSYTGGKGDDQLSTGGSALAVGGALTLSMGAGSNKFQAASGELSVGGGLTYTGGKDADLLQMNTTQATVAGALKFLAGAGANVLSFTGDELQVGKSLLYLSGKNVSNDPGGLSIAGNKAVSIGTTLTYTNPIGQQTFALSGDSVHIGGAVLLNASPGNDSTAAIGGTSVSTGKVTFASTGGHLSFAVSAQQLSVAGAVMARGARDLQITGTGTIAGAVTLSSTTSLILSSGGNGQLIIGGALAYKANSALTNASLIGNVTATGKTDFQLRSGTDNLTIEGSRFLKALTINGGEGSDTITIETQNEAGTTLFAGPVAINLGAGADTLTAGSMNANDHLTALKKFLVTGGGGGGDTVSLLNGTNVFVEAPIVH